MGKITHQDVGQIDMYVRMYDELKCKEGDNPTLGILLCAETDEDIARYSVLHDNDRLFMSKYLTYLPTFHNKPDFISAHNFNVVCVAFKKLLAVGCKHIGMGHKV